MERVSAVELEARQANNRGAIEGSEGLRAALIERREKTIPRPAAQFHQFLFSSPHPHREKENGIEWIELKNE